MTHTNIITALNAKANLTGATFTGNISAPVVDAFNLRENGTNISSIYAYSSIEDNNKNISDQQFSEVRDMIQSGNGSVAETTTTILKIKEQLKVKSSTLFTMLVSPTEITMNSTLNINSSTNPSCIINNPTVANSKYIISKWSKLLECGYGRWKLLY